MKRALLLCLALAAVVAAVLFATCDERVGAPTKPATPGAQETPATKIVPRKRTDAHVDDEAAGAAPTAEATTPPVHEPEIVLVPSGVKIAAPKHLLRGRVVDAEGKPMPGVEVVLRSTWLPHDVIDDCVSWPPQAEAKIRTGGDGRFGLPYWEGGPRDLRVLDGDKKLRWHALGWDDGGEHEIVLADHGADVVVRTTSAADGKLVTALHVTIQTMPLYDKPATFDEVLGEQASDECAVSAGVHRFDSVAPGPAVLEIEASGFAPVFDRIVVADHGEQTIDVPLVVGRTIRGHVIDGETGANVANAWLHAGYYVFLETHSDADGRFALEHVPAKPHEVQTFRAGADGYVDAEFLDDGRDRNDVVVALRRGASLLARCVDEHGAPLANVVFCASSDRDATPPGGLRWTMTSTMSDLSGADGRAELNGLSAGSAGVGLRVRFYEDGVPVLERSYPPLVDGETRDLGDVVLAPGLTLRGTVLDADGKPVAGATVVAAAHDADDERHAAIGSAVISHSGRRAETQPDGTFALMGLTKGLWDLYVSADIFSPGRLSIGVDPTSGDVSLRVPRVVALVGRVVDAKGSPVANADVRSAREEFGLRTIVSCGTGDDGRFSVPGFDADSPEVEVSVKPPGGAAQKFTARPGVPSTELRLR